MHGILFLLIVVLVFEVMFSESGSEEEKDKLRMSIMSFLSAAAFTLYTCQWLLYSQL